MTKTAYAVAVDGEVQTNTVHGHARGAMVNFLATQVAPWNTPEGQQKMGGLPDQVITGMFAALTRTYAQIQLVLITINVVQPEDPSTMADVTAPPPPAPGTPKAP